MDKTAFLQDAGNNIKTWWKGLDPTMQKTMMGAGVGGALGLGSSMLKEKEDRQHWHSTLMGGLAGGAIGGGIGLAQKARGDLPTSAGGATADRTTFKHPKTGKVYRFKPGTPPEVMAQMAEMDHSQRGTQGPGMKALEATGKVIGDSVMSPEGAVVGTGLAGIGVGKGLSAAQGPITSSRFPRVAGFLEKLRPYAKLPFSGQVGGLSAAESTNPEHLRKGIVRAITDNTTLENIGARGERPVTEVARSTSEKVLGSPPQGHSGAPDVTTSVSSKTGTKKFNVTPQLQKLSTKKKLLAAAAKGDTRALAVLRSQGITPEMLGQLKQVGVDTEVGASLLKRLNPNHVHGTAVKCSKAWTFPRRWAKGLPGWPIHDWHNQVRQRTTKLVWRCFLARRICKLAFDAEGCVLHVR